MTVLGATRWAVHVPGHGLADAARRVLGSSPGAWAAPAVPPEDAARLLGRRGMLGKDPATRLALCAVHRALGRAPGERRAGPVDPDTAVVACGNLGSVATVARIARAVAAEGGRAASVLDAPNVSPNVVASTVASWFGLGGPNLAVCSGDTAGADGFRLAGVLLRSGRARRVVLVGAEAADEVATALHAADDPAGPSAARRSLRAGAAAVVLGPAGRGPARATVCSGDVEGPAVSTHLPAGSVPGAAGGDCYGAQGVVSLALALHLAVDEAIGTVAVPWRTGPDGWCTVRVPADEEGPEHR